MHALVEDIAAYPEFLPWCSGTDIVSRDDHRTIATIKIDYRGLQQRFTTENSSDSVECIRMKLLSGPFRRLEGEWRFAGLGERACKVSLNLEYEFSGRLLEMALGPVFHFIADNMVDAFVLRAEKIYGTSDSPQV
jgi:ribosome-associated toxin RatA of RatAB toxin-antitoxin module